MIIPNSWRLIKEGEVLQEGDRFCSTSGGGSDRTSGWSRCHSSIGYPYLKHGKGLDIYHTAIRKIEKEPFKIGEKVFVKWSNGYVQLDSLGIVRSILSDVYVIEFNSIVLGSMGIDSAQIAVPYKYVSEPSFKVAGHEVKNIEGGVQIGCTKVTDDEIRAVAKFRNLKLT